MKTLLAQLDENEIALVAGGETEGGCVDPQPDPYGDDHDDVVFTFNGVEIRVHTGV